jgi:hypothetical protein
LITGLLTAVFALTSAPPLVLPPFGIACFVILAWRPLRLRGFSVELHDAGLLLSRGQVAKPVAFEDVDEVWFEIDVFGHTSTVTAISGLRLVTYGHEVHRVLLGVGGAAVLVGAVLKACSAPLLGEARRALGAGDPLTFGDVCLDRAGITVRGRALPWSAVRLAVVQGGKLRLYRRFPIFAWRTVRLDRVPHPTVFLALLASLAPELRVDDAFIVPFASASEHAAAAKAATGDDGVAIRSMFVGGASLLIGGLVTWATFASGASWYVIAYGPMIFGAIRFFQGLRAYLSRR